MDDDHDDRTRSSGPPRGETVVEPRLLEAAGAVADGEDTLALDPDDLVYGELRLLARLAKFHRDHAGPEIIADDPSATLGELFSRTRHEFPSRPDLSQAPRWGPLFVLELVGRGAFGDVYRAWDPALDREVALKRVRLPPAAKAKATAVVREGQLLASVNHPNVINVHGAAEIDGEVGIWMEFVRGRTLEQVVADDGPITAQEATLVAESLCGALEAVHNRQLLHRDIKATNVMRSASGRVVLLDFGASDEVDGNSAEPRRMAGTPLYMAPEVLNGEAATAQSDIYSLAVLLFYLVTGSYPVYGKTLAQIKAAHQNGRRPLLADVRSDVPVRFARAVERALAPDRKLRPQTVGEWLRLLQDSRPATPTFRTIAAVTVPALILFTFGIWALGLVSSLAYNTSAGRSGEFGRESMAAYWVWGARSLIAPIFVIAVATLASRTCWTMARPLARRLPPLDARRARYWHQWSTSSAMSEAVVFMNAVLLAALCYGFRPVIYATSSRLATADLGVFWPFQPANATIRNLFSVAFSLGLLISVASWLSVERRAYRQSRRIQMPTRFAAGFVTLLFLFLLAVCWRIGWQNKGARYQFGSERCYAIGETATDLLLYCPRMEAPKVRSVPVGDARLQRDEVVENIFTP